MIGFLRHWPHRLEKEHLNMLMETQHRSMAASRRKVSSWMNLRRPGTKEGRVQLQFQCKTSRLIGNHKRQNLNLMGGCWQIMGQ